MKSRLFETFQVGEIAELTHVITQSDVEKFVALTGDDNPLHVDKQYAKTTVFKEPVAHGKLGASFISTLIGKHIPGDGALWVSQSFEFLLPVRIGDTLTISAKIIEKHDTQRMLVLETDIVNQHKQTVVRGVAKVKKMEQAEHVVESTDTPVAPVVIVVGASRGIGAQTAIQLAGAGYRVAVVYFKDKSGADEVVATITSQDGQASAYCADVRDSVAVAGMVTAVIRQYGTVTDLVFGDTSKIIATDFGSLTWPDMASHLDIQVKGAFHCIQNVLPEFCQNKRGSVVVVGSVATDGTPPLKWAGYTASKAALVSLVKSLAVEYGPQGIRFNAVYPGMTDTGLIADIPEKARMLAKMQTPLRRLAQCEDIAGTIAFLLSPAARHITGETIRVNGGQVML